MSVFQSEKIPLGKPSVYISTYTPELLFPVPRKIKRDELALGTALDFDGVDIWNAYELSWLNTKGKPQIAMAEFYMPCTSEYLIESKSLKLYLNSFNNSIFSDETAVLNTLKIDLSAAVKAPVEIKMLMPQTSAAIQFEQFPGRCLDELDIKTDIYHYRTDFLATETDKSVEEQLYSHLLKSNCLVTGQPDFGSVFIQYRGSKINHEGLLKYIISFREHIEFAEHCVERMFMDIFRCCQPELLTVYLRYTRRGGLDINPFRSNFQKSMSNGRHYRQ